MDYTDAKVFIKKHSILSFAKRGTTHPVYEVHFTFVGLLSKCVEIIQAMESNERDNVRALDDLGLLGSNILRPFMCAKLPNNKYIYEDMAYYYMDSPGEFTLKNV